MSTEKSQKNFDATPARKEKAKRDGNVARSTEVAGIAAFACAAVATFAVIPAIGACAAAALRSLAGQADPFRPPAALSIMLGISFLPAVAAGIGALGAGMAQAGGLRVTLPKLQLQRLNPVAGLKRMLGGEAIVGVVRAVVAFGVASGVLWPLVLELFTRSTTVADPRAFGALALDGMQRACCAAILTGAAFAGIDYALARRRWLRDIKMSLEELRRDQKENDGDPHARSRRKTLHRSFTRGSVGRTKEASFVVVNPTHIAIAIRYAPPAVAVPEILVRAADEGALSVKAIAREHGIPIVENIVLARVLYAQGEAGRAIPSPTFVAVARVIAELLRAGVLT
jgi:flagellar biosynthesis protein FlhB